MFFKRSFSIYTKLNKKTVSSHLWLERQKKDPFVKRAIKETYRARSAFKLIEIDDKYKIFNYGDTIIDIGATPGSWTQVAVKRSNADKSDNTNNKYGFVIGVDRDYIEPINGAHLLSYSNIEDEKVIKNILDLVKDKPVRSVISDMAPNASGDKCLDHEVIISLQLKALNLAKQCLKQDGIFICKLWHGDSLQEFSKTLKKNFETVNIIKPSASRTESSEIFILASKYKTSSN